MKEIDYSVPNKEKDITPQFKVGDYVIGDDSLFYDRGQIEKIEMSTGERKGLIYKIGLNYYFYNFIKPWYDGMIIAKIGIKKLYQLPKPIKFTMGREKMNITGLYALDNSLCYLIVDKDLSNNEWYSHGIDESGLIGIGFYELRPKQIERIYNLAFGNN